ncbi:ABC transporter permease [Paenibacillus sp. N3/727]|uniref:ABC transporter permease n=1 Tax=Paenibacillus sp. N3/727 TaxID=2925845 RepID=UPI001F52D7E2|nr:ABC transporter permease [Paenibacillus sp. N3/727]UNK16924.1 ABC transporter permease [Paenibacillus sp. N3/727]
MGTQTSGKYRGILVGQLVLLLILLALCELLVRTEVVSSLYLPAPTQVSKAMVELFQDREIYKHIYVTLGEFVVGYSVSVITGIAVGMFLVLVPWAEKFFRPYLSALMAIPKVTIVPLLALWLGIGVIHKISIVFLFCFFTIAMNTITGIKQTADQHMKVAQVFEASRYQTIMKVILPSAAPTIFAGLRISAAAGLVGALFGEMLASKDGLGNILVKATSLYNTAQAFAIVVLVTLVSVLLIALIDLLERKVFMKWKSS